MPPASPTKLGAEAAQLARRLIDDGRLNEEQLAFLTDEANRTADPQAHKLERLRRVEAGGSVEVTEAWRAAQAVARSERETDLAKQVATLRKASPSTPRQAGAGEPATGRPIAG
ncbi:MAG: hypothetical protein JNL80_00255 [Phycisphaerae bacterium]|nr:hypothetical protein [Phycisphaerae bacterium]